MITRCKISKIREQRKRKGRSKERRRRRVLFRNSQMSLKKYFIITMRPCKQKRI
jgi:hypothetical protein